MKLARGNAGATTQDILTVLANGVLRETQKPIGNYPMGGDVALTAVLTKLPIYNDYSEGITFSNESATIITAGSYLITANMVTDATGDAQMCQVFKNGAFVKSAINSASGFGNQMCCAFMTYLAAGDVIDLRAQRGSTSCNAVGGKTSLELVMVK
jgi:hypothetical protein